MTHVVVDGGVCRPALAGVEQVGGVLCAHACVCVCVVCCALCNRIQLGCVHVLSPSRRKCQPCPLTWGPTNLPPLWCMHVLNKCQSQNQQRRSEAPPAHLGPDELAALAVELGGGGGIQRALGALQVTSRERLTVRVGLQPGRQNGIQRALGALQASVYRGITFGLLPKQQSWCIRRGLPLLQAEQCCW